MPSGWARFRFYAALNDLLPGGRKQADFAHFFRDRASVKDMIEALGIPHTEVELILVNGEPVDFSYLVQAGDRVSVYPAFMTLDLGPLARLRPPRRGQARFVLDGHLGKLATYLRLLGFDALYRPHPADEDLAALSQTGERILLTRDRGLLKRSVVTHGYLVRETDPRRQVLEVLERFALAGALAPFRRCLLCNAVLELVAKELVYDRLPPKIRECYQEFHLCRGCNRVYWKGSHYDRMRRFIRDVVGKR